MSFTDQKPRTATKQDIKAPWSGRKGGKNFRCGFCGYRFKVGDYWRFVYTNDTKGAGGNPLICMLCDDGATREELAERRIELRQQYNAPKFWSFRRESEAIGGQETLNEECKGCHHGG